MPRNKKRAAQWPLFFANVAGRSDRTAHVFAAAHGRLNLAVTIGALGNLYIAAIGQSQGVVFEGSITCGASCIDAHSTFSTGISCHHSLLTVI